MHEQMNLLKEVQGIDSEMLVIRETRQKYTDELDALEGECGQIKVMVEALTEELAGLEAERRQLQVELEKEQDRIAQVEGRLPQIQTQKEYVAVLKEIDAAKKETRETEEAMATKDEAISVLESDKLEKDQKLEELSTALAGRQEELASELATLQEQLDTKGSERDKLLAEIPITLRKRYQTLVNRRNGLAVVGARSGACLGCNMHLPPQVFNSLYKLAKIETCPHCNRMLYLAED